MDMFVFAREINAIQHFLVNQSYPCQFWFLTSLNRFPRVLSCSHVLCYRRSFSLRTSLLGASVFTVLLVNRICINPLLASIWILLKYCRRPRVSSSILAISVSGWMRETLLDNLDDHHDSTAPAQRQHLSITHFTHMAKGEKSGDERQ